jgi:hypothetical protein
MNNNNTNNINTNCIKNSKISPMSGSEPEFNPEKWENNKKYNNCYAYGLDDHRLEPERQRKSIPGFNSNFYTCSQIMDGLYAEIPGIYPTTFDCQCNTGYRKIYTAVSDEDDNNDFHFWRQDKNGKWSHKIGTHSVSTTDADNNDILNPQTSNKKFPAHNYSNSCGFYCVPIGSKDVE